jgi:hypothetical protein
MAPTSVEKIGKMPKIPSRIWAGYTTFSSQKQIPKKKCVSM